MKSLLARAVVSGSAFLLSIVVAAGCGGGNITLGGGGGGNTAKVTFTGDLDAVSPVTTRDIVAFVYNIDDNSERCPCPPDPSGSSVGKGVVLSSGTTTFEIAGLEPGKFGVVFLLDKAGNAADGTIDDGDPIAILDDVTCALDSVAGDNTVDLEKVDISFSTDPKDECKDGVKNPPAAGRARANRITIARTVASE